jgi:hypothetical protein
VELYADAKSMPNGVAMTLRGAEVVATTALAGARRSRHVGLALINGSPGIVLAPSGRLVLALAFTIPDDRITRIEVIADADRLAQLDLAVLG